MLNQFKFFIGLSLCSKTYSVIVNNALNNFKVRDTIAYFLILLYQEADINLNIINLKCI